MRRIPHGFAVLALALGGCELVTGAGDLEIVARGPADASAVDADVHDAAAEADATDDRDSGDASADAAPPDAGPPDGGTWASCLAWKTAGGPSGIVTIDPDGDGGAPPFDAYCDSTSDGGGFVLVLKAGTSFTYDSPFWTNASLLAETSLDLSPTEAKLAAYLSVPVHELRVVFRTDADRSVVLTLPSTYPSTRDLFAGGAVATAGVSTSALMGLIPDSRLQIYRTAVGINLATAYDSVRLGALGDNSPGLDGPDSYIGFGGKSGAGCHVPSVSFGASPTGNLACWEDIADVSGSYPAGVPPQIGSGGGGTYPAEQKLDAFGYLFVR